MNDHDYRQILDGNQERCRAKRAGHNTGFSCYESWSPDRGALMKSRQVIRWIVDIALGFVFLVSFTTGFIKLAVLLRIPGFSDTILPLAWISGIHDRAGVILCILVFVHLFLNRKWIVSMTGKILSGKDDEN